MTLSNRFNKKLQSRSLTSRPYKSDHNNIMQSLGFMYFEGQVIKFKT